MAEKIYGIVGSFAMKPGSQKGIHIFRYEPENAVFTHLGDFCPEINAGQGTYNREKDVVYITHEHKDRENEIGGGGRILAFKLDHETGKPEWISDKETCASLPSYLCLDASGKYVLAPHHSTGSVITRTVKGPDGGYRAVTECDDATVAVFSVNEDGSYGKITDVFREEPEREDGKLKKMSHLHSCVQSPDGNLFLVCDKGLDSIHGYHLNTENGTLEKVSGTFVEEGAHPRYGKFHPTLPVFYQNCEASAFLHVWNYDSRSGELKRIQKIPLLASEEEAAAWTKEGASDLVVTPDGKYLYAAVRGLNVLAAFAIHEDGTLSFLHNISCHGENPRGLALSPDARFLFSLNRDSGCIARFRREEDGSLTDAGAETACILPGNMQFIVYDS